MLAHGTKIKAGLSLAPADVVILTDGQWDPSDDKQLLARVVRNSATQPAKYCEGIRLICSLDWLPLDGT